MSVPVLSEDERGAHARLGAPPRTGPGVDVAESLHDCAIRTPDAPAIIDGDTVLCYRDLQDRVTRFAAGLRTLGVGPRDVVGLLLPRSPELVIGILGALRSGNTFTVVDPGSPVARVRHLMAQTNAALVVANDAWDLGRPVVRPRAVVTAAAYDEVGRVHERPAPASVPAYVLFTSGSTGFPKGVVISHVALRAYLEAIVPAYGLVAGDRVLHLAEPGFDVALEEILPTIAAGGVVVIAAASWLDSPVAFCARLARHRVTVVNLPSSLWVTLFRHEATGEFVPPPPDVRLVVVGSERVPAAAYLAWRRTAPAGVRLINAYGTTETTVTSIVYEANPADPESRYATGSVPIGMPLSNTTVRVVDRQGNPTPFGVAGELVIGGPSVFSGYLGAGEAEPAYRTGDLVQLEPSGTLVHVGRVDAQVKIRGHRIEPAEVEAALEALPGVRAALCAGVNDRLVAAILPEGRPRGAQLLREVSATLPRWLVPDEIQIVAALPVNGRGKADRTALRASPAEPSPPADDPMTPAEHLVARCFTEVLGRRVADPLDSFFALGGNSLQAIRLVALMNRDSGTTLAARQVFATPTVRGLARELDSPAPGNLPPLVRHRDRTQFPLTPSQRAMLRTLGSPESPRPYFEMTEVFRIRGPLDRDALTRALRCVVRDNEPLRTTVDSAASVQRVRSDLTPTISYVDLLAISTEAERPAVLGRELDLASRPFNLTAEPPFRAVLCRLDTDVHVLSLTFHHLFFDGWSFGLVYARLSAAYAALAAGEEPPTHRIVPEFGDYAAWLDDVYTEDIRGFDLAYWRDQLAGYRVPRVWSRVTATECTSTVAAGTFDRPLADALDELAASLAATPFALLLATFAVVLGGLLDEPDLLIASNDANRFQGGTEEMIGYLAASQLARIEPRPGDTFVDLVRRTHARMVSGRQHMSAHWEDLLGTLGLSGGLPFRFSLQDTGDAGTLDLTGTTVELLPEEPAPGGRRAVVVTASRAADGYHLLWYTRDDLELAVASSSCMEVFARTAASVAADPGLSIRELQRRLAVLR